MMTIAGRFGEGSRFDGLHAYIIAGKLGEPIC